MPEVMVKVTGSGRDAAQVVAHSKYIGRHGKLEILTDDGKRLAAKSAARELLEDWDLDL